MSIAKVNNDRFVRSPDFTRRHKGTEKDVLKKMISLCGFVALCDTRLFTTLSIMQIAKFGNG
jgi:hypothetical protein